MVSDAEAHHYEDVYKPRYAILAIPALTANLCIDLFITGVVSWKLYTSKTGVHHETDSMLSRLMALTWETAAPPAISAILNVVFYVAAPETAVHMFFNMLTPRLYVFSFMHTLLVRPSIRSGSKSATDQEAGSSDATSKIRRVTTGNRHQLATFRKGHKENQSIGQTNTIPVQVQTETVIHTAPSDDYQRKKQSAGSIQLQGHPVVTISKPGDLSKFEEDNWSLGSSSSVNGKGDQKDSYHMYDVTNRKDGV
ncbi:hypothetical protein FRC03_008796 [Tulasnella sp. 419]|nr:hypothetical protein FRC03_008796 [Tulasnella sp. 419]